MRLDQRVDAADLASLAGFDPDDMVADLDQIVTSPVTLRDLYYRWERTNWSVHTLDFERDVTDWQALGTDVQERLLWVLSMFFHGEECVAQTLAPWVASAPTEEMQLFLSTQLADEARHAIFFDRFYEEVVGASGTLRDRLDWCRPRVSTGFEKLFYDMLPAVAAEVRDNPRDPVVFARGVALYHILLEGALAVPGQKFILAFCRDRDILPAYRSGFTAVARDESRHVGAGVRILQELVAMDRDAVPAVQELIREALPFATQQFQPPGGDFTYLTVLGYSTYELFSFGLHSLEKRLRAANIPLPRTGPIRLPEVDGEPILPDRPLTAVQEMMQPMRDQITPALIFQGLPMAFNAQAAKGVDAHYRFDVTGEGGGTWTIHIADGTCEVTQGTPPVEPDWRLELSAETWTAMAVGDILGQEAFLLGRVTIEGDPLAGLRFDRFFTPDAGAPAA